MILEPSKFNVARWTNRDLTHVVFDRDGVIVPMVVDDRYGKYVETLLTYSAIYKLDTSIYDPVTNREIRLWKEIDNAHP